MDIFKGGNRPTRIAPNNYFTGTVLQDPIVEAPAPARLRATLVTFTPGARTFWHTHPLGQTLYIVSGVGRVQSWGGPLREVRAGDVVWFAPGEKHWHGANPSTAMAHVAMQEAKDENYVEWQEEVSDADFAKTPRA
jgi:quercetin dioxygenase-like cupin family protein